MTPNERNRIMAAALGKSAAPFPTTAMFVVEDPDKFGPGCVVVADGSKRRMLITKVVAGFAECLWRGTERIRFDIIHTSMLTLDRDQKWQR